MSIKDIWPTKILISNIDGIDNTLIAEFILSNIELLNITFVPGWDSNTQSTFGSPEGRCILNGHLEAPIPVQREFDKITKGMLDAIYTEYLPSLGDHTVSNPVVLLEESFINVATPGSFQEFHQHLITDISCVYYIQAEKGMGDLVLDNFHHNISKNLNPTFLSRYIIPANTGGLRMFMSTVPHQANINESNQPRISIACNFLVEESNNEN
jgi:hypothetical protein